MHIREFGMANPKREVLQLLLSIALTIFSWAATADQGTSKSPNGGEMENTVNITDFSGDWVPKFKQWEGITAFLKLQEAPWIIKKSWGKVPYYDHMVQDDTSLKSDMVGPVPDFAKSWFVVDHEYIFDNSVRDENTPLGNPAKSRHYWDKSGSLISIHECENSDGLKYNVVQTRYLSEDGNTQIVDMVANLGDGNTLKAKMIFTRK